MNLPNINGRLTFLFLGGAKRVRIARQLKEACRRREMDCRIVGYEMDSHSALAAEGQVVEGLRWSDPDILNDIDSVVERFDVDVILPFVDGAVGIVARYIEMFKGRNVFAPVGSYDAVTAMFDKIAAADIFERHGLPVPPTYRLGDSPAGLIAKPRFGSASKGLIFIDSIKDLYAVSSQADRYLIQQRIDRKEEFTVDCYIGMRDGTIAAVSPRLRAEVCGGEVVRTETVSDLDADALARRAIAATGMRGAVTVQLLRCLDTGRLMVMEINPRLGGGVVASINAGADIADLIVADALGETLAFRRAVPGVETVRYFDDVVFYPHNNG